MKEYIRDPGAQQFWDLNQEEIRRAHQSILQEFESVMEHLRKDIKSGEIAAVGDRLFED